MDDPSDEPILRLLQPDEQLQAIATTNEARLLVTNRRFAVAVDDRISLDISIDQLRRIQFDIEKSRPATLSSWCPKALRIRPRSSRYPRSTIARWLGPWP